MIFSLENFQTSWMLWNIQQHNLEPLSILLYIWNMNKIQTHPKPSLHLTWKVKTFNCCQKELYFRRDKAFGCFLKKYIHCACRQHLISMPIKPSQHYTCWTQCDNMHFFKAHFSDLFCLDKLRWKAAIMCKNTCEIKMKINITKLIWLCLLMSYRVDKNTFCFRTNNQISWCVRVTMMVKISTATITCGDIPVKEFEEGNNVAIRWWIWLFRLSNWTTMNVATINHFWKNVMRTFRCIYVNWGQHKISKNARFTDHKFGMKNGN